MAGKLTKYHAKMYIIMSTQRLQCFILGVIHALLDLKSLHLVLSAGAVGSPFPPYSGSEGRIPWGRKREGRRGREGPGYICRRSLGRTLAFTGSSSLLLNLSKNITSDLYKGGKLVISSQLSLVAKCFLI